MPRKQKTLHYIYKTTCLITNKYYIGMHSAYTLDDGYLGSGTIIRRSIRKYGKENHVREIIEFCKSKEDLPIRESQIITESVLADPLCINLRLGGSGNSGGHRSSGWKMPPMTDEHRANLKIARNNRKPISDDTRKKMSDSHKGKVRTEEHKKNNREALKKSEKFQNSIKSEEHRKLVSENMKAYHLKLKAEGKPIPGAFGSNRSNSSNK
jgi:hypothetical protein